MKIDLTEKQFRRLLDLVYVGNWVMNSTRGDDRIREYDDVESTVFANCLSHGMVPLVEAYQGELIPSRAFAEGGIHEAIMAYEDTMFFEILAQELALRDMETDSPTPENVDELRERIRSIAAEHGMTLNDAQTQQLADLFRKIQSIGGSNFAERVQDLPETVEKIRESGESALSTAGTVWDSIRGFFRSVAKTLSAIFGG